MINRRPQSLGMPMEFLLINQVAWTISKMNHLIKEVGHLLENHFYLRKIPIICIGIILMGLFTRITFSINLQTPLAGNPIYSEKEVNEWTDLQKDSNLSVEDKIKATINTYFTLKYESYKRGELLDFGFLFDLANPQASEDYAYERGLLYYMLTGWKHNKTLLISYNFDLLFYQFEILNDHATVETYPLARVVHMDSPDRVDSHTWFMHKFSFIKKDGCWVIEGLISSDMNHNLFPPGTDFNKLAENLPERIKAYEAEAEKMKKNIESP